MCSDNTVIQITVNATTLDVIQFDDEHKDDVSEFCSAFEVACTDEQGPHWTQLNPEIVGEAMAEYLILNQLDSGMTLLPVSALQTWLSDRIGQEICVKFKE